MVATSSPFELRIVVVVDRVSDAVVDGFPYYQTGTARALPALFTRIFRQFGASITPIGSTDIHPNARPAGLVAGRAVAGFPAMF
jgi:hypothetical protein